MNKTPAATLSLWEHCTSILRIEMSPQAFTTWIRPIKPREASEFGLELEVPSVFFREWISGHHQS